MKYVNFDKNGKILGYYTYDVDYDLIPENCMEISDEEWQEAINMNANYFNETAPTGERFSVVDFRGDEEILKELKSQKISQLHQNRECLSHSDFVFENHTYKMSADVQSDILSTITIFGVVGSLPEGYTLKCLDEIENRYIPFDLPKLVRLSAGVATRKATLIFMSQKIEDKIEACSTKEEIEMVDVSLT